MRNDGRIRCSLAILIMFAEEKPSCAFLFLSLVFSEDKSILISTFSSSCHRNNEKKVMSALINRLENTDWRERSACQGQMKFTRRERVMTKFCFFLQLDKRHILFPFFFFFSFLFFYLRSQYPTFHFLFLPLVLFSSFSSPSFRPLVELVAFWRLQLVTLSSQFTFFSSSSSVRTMTFLKAIAGWTQISIEHPMNNVFSLGLLLTIVYSCDAQFLTPDQLREQHDIGFGARTHYEMSGSRLTDMFRRVNPDYLFRGKSFFFLSFFSSSRRKCFFRRFFPVLVGRSHRLRARLLAHRRHRTDRLSDGMPATDARRTDGQRIRTDTDRWRVSTRQRGAKWQSRFEQRLFPLVEFQRSAGSDGTSTHWLQQRRYGLIVDWISLSLL